MLLPRRPDDLLSRALAEVKAKWERKQGDTPNEADPDDETAAALRSELGVRPAPEDDHDGAEHEPPAEQP
ncbi:hypothetical protein ACF082_34045 [Streptomyces lydicus]|uniref:hypothetical protein n=1 Tax=Streptomyces lydicus TaxID=47763 RepID=UPI0036F71093